MVDVSVLRVKLRYGLDFKAREKMAGHWMVWITGEGKDERIRYERIKRREGKKVIGERHTRKPLTEVWVLASDYDLDAHWPPYPVLECLGCEPLRKADAHNVMLAAIEAKGG